MRESTSNHEISTKIAWSFAHHNINADLAELITKERFDALRLVYFPSLENRISEFLQAIRSREDYAPIILDVALRIRATVADTSKVISMGDVISLAPASQPKQDAVLVKTDEWGELFKPNASIHIGNDVELKCLEVHTDHVLAQVVQGENIPALAVIKVPSTYADNIAEVKYCKLEPLEGKTFPSKF